MKVLRSDINLQYVRACFDSIGNIRYIKSRIDKIPVLYGPPVLPERTLIENEKKQALYDMIMSLYPYVDDSIARHNLHNLTIRKLPFSLIDALILLYKTEGYYDDKKNRIYLSNSEDLDTLYHELGHAFSSIIYNGIRYSGFSQFDPITRDDNFKGLCEQYAYLLQYRRKGCTELDKASDNFYSALLMDAIIGREEMAKLYFTANTKELVEKMEAFISKAEYLKYLRLLDFVDRLEECNIFNKKASDEMMHEFNKQIRDYENMIISSYEDNTHSRLVLKI